MIQQNKPNARAVAFTLALALVFTTLFTGLGMPGLGQMGDKDAWGVGEAHAATETVNGIDLDIGMECIYANGHSLIISQGAAISSLSLVAVRNRQQQ